MEDCLFEFWRSLATVRDAPVIWWGRNLAIFLAQINLSFFFFFNSFHICLRVLWGIACICMINICMADNVCNYWLFTDISVNAVYIKGHYNVIIDYIGRPSVWLASVWMIVSMWLLMYEQEHLYVRKSVCT